MDQFHVNKDYKIIDIAKKIAFILDYKGNLKNKPKKPDGAKSKLMNSGLIKKFGWQAKINLNNGLKKIQFFGINRTIIIN